MTDNYFDTRSFASVVEAGCNAPARRKIAGCFLYEDTNTFLYSRTNMGKSIFAFQVAYAAATGTSISTCSALRNDCEPMKTLVVDLEMDAKTLFERHGATVLSSDPELLANLVYLHEKIDQKVLIGFDLLDKIEQAAVENEAKLIIIDNISKLIPDALKAENVARVIDTLKRIRQKTQTSFLVIGHTVKSASGVAISNSSYFGSSSFEKFFLEIFYLDATKDGRFFLCHAKSKQKEQYTELVPVLSRGDHPVCGLGFTYECICNLADVQLPLSITYDRPARKANLSEYHDEISILDKAGIKRTRIAEIFNVSRSAISQFFET
jgi:hypothetical protein